MINGCILRDAILSASNNIYNHRQEVDELNVFPVPDGDTGTNMSMTITAAARELALLKDNCTTETVVDTAASALLKGARGNSGVILSLLFRGFSKAFKNTTEIDGSHFVEALTLGVEAAYAAVMRPTEGTIFTVAREAAEVAAKKLEETKDPIVIWQIICEQAALTLKNTPNLLPVLKKAGVVDAGGKGLVIIFEGMRSVFETGVIIEGGDARGHIASAPKSIVASVSEEITFTYCTEFLIEQQENVNDVLRLRAYLESIGDCVVVVEDKDIVKVHIHTNDPGHALQAALEYGQLVNIKIDNMRKQHSNAEWGTVTADVIEPVVAEPIDEYGFVAVADGSGLQTLFQDLGVQNIVKGGQTMNPSTEDILAAIMATPARHVFVLPNNKNIILAAEQAIPLADRTVNVLPTKSIPQGLSAMLAFDPEQSAEENHINMMKAAERVQTGQITFAARDSNYDGMQIREGQILGLENGKISLVETDMVKAAFRVTRHLFKKGQSSFITILYGNGATPEQANILHDMLVAKYGSEIDITVVDGGQSVYYFIIAVE